MEILLAVIVLCSCSPAALSFPWIPDNFLFNVSPSCQLCLLLSQSLQLNHYPRKQQTAALLFLFLPPPSAWLSDKHVSVQSCRNLTNNLQSIQTGSHYPVATLICRLTSVERSLLRLLQRSAHPGLLQGGSSGPQDVHYLSASPLGTAEHTQTKGIWLFILRVFIRYI